MFGSLTIMIVLAIGMFYGQAQYKNKRAEWGKTLTIFCGILIIITAMWQNIFNAGAGDLSSVRDREKAYMNAQCKYLANYLKDNYNGNDKCLIILPAKDTSAPKSTDLDDKIAAFKEGFNNKISDIKTVPVKENNMNPENPDQQDPMEMFEATSEDFNKVLEENSGYDLVIIMASLPYGDDIYNINIFKEKEDDDQKAPTDGILNGYI
ncbi:MAG: hypothetical protein HRT88_21710, partial [Lentisphaeraceae bacterium]|nr:hypothetical protein [Lentisphaeraceae bacterium]